MVYQTDFINAVEGPALKEAYENDDSTELLDIIEDYSRHNDYLKMKNQLHELGQQLLEDYQPKSPQVETFISLQDAICWFTENELLSKTDMLTLQNMIQEGHKHLPAVWETFLIQGDRNDMLDSLKVILSVRTRGKRSSPTTSISS